MNTATTLDPSICKFLTAARVVQQYRTDFVRKRETVDSTDLESVRDLVEARNLLDAACDLLCELSPFDATNTIAIW